MVKTELRFNISFLSLELKNASIQRAKELNRSLSNYIMNLIITDLNAKKMEKEVYYFIDRIDKITGLIERTFHEPLNQRTRAHEQIKELKHSNDGSIYNLYLKTPKGCYWIDQINNTKPYKLEDEDQALKDLKD